MGVKKELEVRCVSAIKVQTECCLKKSGGYSSFLKFGEVGREC